MKIRFSLCLALLVALSPVPWPSVPLQPSSSAAVAQSKPIAQTLSQPITLYQPLQHLQWQGDAISKTGIAYFPLEGFLNSSLTVLDLESARAGKDPHKIALTLATLALSRQLDRQTDKAIAYYTEALTIVEAHPEVALEAMIRGNLGLVRLQAGDYSADTIEYLEAYVKLTQGDRKIRALGNLANAYFGADLYAKAIALHQARLALARKAQDQTSEAKTYSDLGIVYQSLGESAKALKYQEQALTLARKIQDPAIESFALGNLGLIHHSRFNYAKAAEFQQQRLTLSRKLKNLTDEAEALGNLGGIAYFQGDSTGAMDYYNQAWAIAWNRLQDANILYRVRGNQGLVYAQMGNTAKALESYQQYFQYASSRSSRREEGLIRINVAAALLQSGNLEGAAKALRQAIDSWESLRSRLGNNDGFKISIFETQNAPYSNLQTVLIAQNQPEAALEISERGRARAFAEMLARRLAILPAKPAGSQLPLASPTIAQIKQISKSHRATLVEYSIIPGQFQVNGKLETHDSELLIWVVQPTGSVTLRRVDLKPLWQCRDQSCSAGELADLAALGRSALQGSRAPAPDRSLLPLNRLYTLLIQPIVDLLPADPQAQVIFIPHRSLLLVPFAALPDAQGKFLIQHHTLSISPSIQVLDLTEQLKKRLGTPVKPSGSKAESLVIGNPTMPKVVTEVGESPEQLSPLPGSEQEAIAIAGILHSPALTGGAATKSTVLQRMQHSQVIHLATHGLIDDFVGLGVPGAIALAPDTPASGIPSVEENGLLTASEIFDLKLKADLVVLSACNTGQGRITGDGIVGLSRALISAQVPSIIVSLWAVPDEPTALLMTEFYRNLQQQPNKAQALRQAMLATMKQHPAPLDWAAFTLIGEAD